MVFCLSSVPEETSQMNVPYLFRPAWLAWKVSRPVSNLLLVHPASNGREGKVKIELFQ